MANAKNEAKIKFTAETHEFNVAIQQATSAMKELRAALALNATEMKNGGDQTQNLLERYSLLTKEYEEQGKVVDNLYEKLEVAKKIYGENSTQVAEYSAKLFQAENAQMKLGQQINECVAEMDRMLNSTGTGQSAYAQLTTTITQQEQELQKLKQAYVNACIEFGKDSQEANQLAGQIDALSGELQENRTRLNEAEQAADSYDRTLAEQRTSFQQLMGVMAELNSAIGTFANSWKAVDSTITNLVRRGINELISATKDIAKYTVDTGMKTESSFAKVSAVMQATDDDMLMLRDAALEVQQGVNPLPYTLNECATAYYYMGLAGWDAQKSATALHPTLALVAASGEDLADVSDIVTDNITAFGLQAEDTQYMVDVLAQTMRSTNTDVGLLGQTFKYAAAPAHAAGYALEDVALAAGLMANNGIKGSQAGTSLRQMFNALAKPTKDSKAAMDELGISLTDNDGKMLSLKGLLDQTRVAFAGLSVNLYDADGNLREYDDILQEVEQTNQDYVAAEKLKNAALIYGTRAMSGVLSIVNMSEEEYRRVTEAIYDYDGACEEMAAIMNDTLEGDVKMFNASLDTLANRLYDNACPALRTFVQTLTEWTNSDESVALIDQISTELTKLLDGVLWNLPNIIQNISTILQGIPAGINAVASAVSFVTEHINGIITAIKAILVIWGTIRAIEISAKIVQMGASLVALIAQIVALTGATSAATVATNALSVAQNALPFGIIITAVGAAIAGIVALVNHIRSLNDNTQQCNTQIREVVSGITPFRDGLTGLTASFHQTNEQMQRMTDIDQQIADGEKRVTEAIRQAVQDHGTLRDQEVQQYQQCVQRFKELEAERLGIYREGVQNIGYEIQASIQSINGMTQAEMQQYLVDLQSALQSSNEAVDAACQSEIDRINQYYKARGESGSQAHLAEIEAAKAHAAEEMAVNQQMYNENLSILVNYASQAVAGDMNMWNQMYANSNKGREAYTANLKQMDLDSAEAFLSMWASAKKAGADIPAETDRMAIGILNSFQNLPPKLEEQGKAVLDGLAGGMESAVPRLKHASDATCNEIVTAIKEDLQINSPSRVTMEIGANVVQGLADGMGTRGSALNSAATNIARGIIQGLTPEAGAAAAIGQKTVGAVESGLSGRQGALTNAAKGIGQNVVKALTPNAASVKKVGADTIAQDQSGLQSKTSSISNAAKTINQNVVKALTPNAASVKKVGADTITQDQSGMQSKSSALNSTAKQISQGAVKALTPEGSQVKSIGGNIVAGIGAGMQEKKGWLGNKIADFASGIIDKFKSAFKIGSPSRIMAEEIGEWLPAGIGKGIEDNAGAAVQPLKSLVNSMTGLKGGGMLGGQTLDISGRIDSHITDAFANNTQFSMMERMAEAMDRLANIEFIINMDISGQRIAQATASATDSVSGTRINLRERGLALE